jgi:tetratricopeptide (TPR) repeat protein
MADSIDELYARWKENPNAEVTLAICDVLRGSGRAQMVEQVGTIAQRVFATSVPVLVATARMYMESDRAADAQTVLVAAGKVSPRDASVYRWLGEVLLRRGDAERAEKVIERAIHFGADDRETRLWLDRARVFRPMQTKAGAKAVASEIAKTASLNSPSPATVPPPRSKAANQFSDDEAPTGAYKGSSPRILQTPSPAPGIAIPRAHSIEAETHQNFAPLPSVAEAADPAPLPSREDARPRTNGHAELSDSAIPIDEATYAPGANAAPLAPSANARGDDASPYRASEHLLTPDPRDVLDALALAGIFEPPKAGAAAAAPTWDKPTTITKRRGLVTLSIAMTLFAGAVVGSFYYVKNRRDIAHQQAEQILAGVETDLHAAHASLLANDEQSLGHAFELDSRSPRAAIDWLRERGMVGLLKGGADVAFENGIDRAKEVGVPENKFAFAYIASFLFQGDTAGAAAAMTKYDPTSQGDAFYQVMAGATLERAGDARAAARYEAAVKLEPNLVIAEIALARAVAVDGDPQKAMDLAKAFHAKYPDRAEGSALVALAWGRDPARSDVAPPEVADAIAHAADLPMSLLVVPPAMAALREIDKHEFKDAKASIEKALTVADGPGMASWMGSIALDTGDEWLARKAALEAVSFSAVYPPARVLAARVALLGGRLDEALKATEEFDASLPDVAAVRAAVAYERVDLDALGRSLEAISPDNKKLPFLQPLDLAPDTLLGNVHLTGDKLIDLSDEEAPWADLIAMDLALDSGNLETAEKIAESWREGDSHQLRSIRLSRLARYQGKLDDAEAQIASAMKNGTVTPRVLTERAYVLIARGKFHEVGPLLIKNPLVLGSLSTWLAAYALASSGKVEDAKSKTASLDPPPPSAPLPSRTLALLALSAMKDKKRGREYAHALLASGATNPDIVNAAIALGFKRTEHAKGRVTYDIEK